MKRIKQLICIMTAALLTLTSIIPVFAGTWKDSPSGRQYEESGEFLKNTWITETSGTYHTDSDGFMDTGWLLDNGKWYLLDPADGHMLTGWQWVDGRCYYLTEKEDQHHPLGSCYINETTPDGFTVSASGAWSVNGIEVYEAGRGASLSPAKTYTSSGSEFLLTKSCSSNYGKSVSTAVKEKNGSDTDSQQELSATIQSLCSSSESEVFAGSDIALEDESECSRGISITAAIATPSQASSLQISDEDSSDGDIVQSEEITTPEDVSMSMLYLSSPMATLAFTSATSESEEAAYDVEWYVRYVDADTHSIEFAAEEHGFVPNGTEIYIGFSKTITDEDGNIWTATTDPGFKAIWGPGVNITYIEYEITGHVIEPEDPYAEAEETLVKWLNTARKSEATLTGESADEIPTSRFICDAEGEADIRLLSAGNAINDTEAHEIYIIACGILPTGIILKQVFGADITYSKDLMDTITTADSTYKVYRFIITRNYDTADCSHNYEVVAEKDAACLTRGYVKYKCAKCGDVKLKYSAATGHIDEDGDSVCDRCSYRVYEESLGNQIATTLNLNNVTYTIQWTLVDQDYEGGCLYIADDGLPASAMGGYGSGKEYRETDLFGYLSSSFAGNHSINGDNLIVYDDDGSSASAHMLSEKTALKYRDLMASGDYVTHTGDGTGHTVIKADSSTYTVSADSDFIVRPAIVLPKPWTWDATPQHWSVGDVLTRTIDGEEYEFTCIDDNYSDDLGNHTQSALFLCNTVIPAGYGGEYRTEIDGDGHYTNVWYAGPIATFGTTNDYKHSNIRSFLDSETVFGADDLVIGIRNSYTGSTTAGRYSQTKANELSTYSIGYQQMTARLFILSVDEALRYKNYLWKFGGSESDNPETVTESTCQSYWLRNPAGTGNDYYETGLAYVVDLAQGNIHPQNIQPEGGTGDPYLDSQTSVGTRPAFILQNK